MVWYSVLKNKYLPTVSVSQGCRNKVPQTGWPKRKYHKLGDLKADIYHLTLLGDRNLKSTCQQDMLPQGPVSDPILASGGLLAITVVPSPADPSRWHGILLVTWSASMCVQISTFYKDTSHTGLEPTLTASF